MFIKNKICFSTKKTHPNNNKFKFINLNLFISSQVDVDNSSYLNLNSKAGLK